MMKVKSRLFHLTKFIDFLIDSQFWGPLYALKCEADLAVLSYRLAACYSFPLYIPNTYIASAFRGILLIGV